MKDSMGGGAAGWLPTSTVTFRRCLISTFWLSVSAKIRSVGFQSRKTGSTGPRGPRFPVYHIWCMCTCACAHACVCMTCACVHVCITSRVYKSVHVHVHIDVLEHEHVYKKASACKCNNELKFASRKAHDASVATVLTSHVAIAAAARHAASTPTASPITSSATTAKASRATDGWGCSWGRSPTSQMRRDIASHTFN